MSHIARIAVLLAVLTTAFPAGQARAAGELAEGLPEGLTVELAEGLAGEEARDQARWASIPMTLDL